MHSSGVGLCTSGLYSVGGVGTSAGGLLYELSRRATANLAGWRRTRKLQEFYENVSLTLARSVASALAAKNRVQDGVRAERARSEEEEIVSRLVDR